MIKFIRGHKLNVVTILAVAVAVTWLAAGWAGEHKLRMEHRELYQQRIGEQQSTIERAQALSVGLMAANAIIIGAWQHEKSRAEENEQGMNVANGRLGPLRRQVNALEGDVQRLRNNWTSELGVER